MLSKKEFCDLLRKFHELELDTAEAHKALKKLDPDFGGLALCRHENFIVDLLKKLMNDEGEHSWIDYFIYEREWGERQQFGGKELGPITINGRNLKLKTPEHLYVLLTEHSINKPAEQC